MWQRFKERVNTSINTIGHVFTAIADAFTSMFSWIPRVISDIMDD